MMIGAKMIFIRVNLRKSQKRQIENTTEDKRMEDYINESSRASLQ